MHYFFQQTDVLQITQSSSIFQDLAKKDDGNPEKSDDETEKKAENEEEGEDIEEEQDEEDIEEVG